MVSSNPNSSDFSYKKYSLEQLDNWIHDAVTCEDLTAQDIYDTIVKGVDDCVNYHKKELSKTTELLSLLKGHREIDLEDVVKEREYYEGWDYTATGEKFPRVTESTQKDWNDFWEEHYYPEEHEKSVYTEEELDAMCEAAATENDKEKCREYNLREVEYYTKRAELDAEVSRNDSTRLKYENGWVYESPDGGKTVTKRRPGTTEKIVVKKEEKKTWTLPVEETKIAETDETEYFITFPDDLLEAANLKEGDNVEWIERKDGSYEMRKV